MLAALGKMTDANQKEMLAGLFLSKFNTKESKAGLELCRNKHNGGVYICPNFN